MFFRRKELKLRELQVRDITEVSKLFLNISSEAKAEVVDLIKESKEKKGKGKKPSEEESLEVGIKIAGILFKILIQYAEEDLKKWLASLLGISVKRFNELPLSEVKNIINQLKEKEELKDFFSGAFSTYKKVDQSAENLKKK